MEVDLILPPKIINNNVAMATSCSEPSFKVVSTATTNIATINRCEKATAIFYRSFRASIKKQRRTIRHQVSLGDFFRLRIPTVYSQSSSVSDVTTSTTTTTSLNGSLQTSVECIGELLLLWSDSMSDQTKGQLVDIKSDSVINGTSACAMAACRLFFRPEETRGGRRADTHGQDEVIALSKTAIVKLETLVSWMQVYRQDNDDENEVKSNKSNNSIKEENHVLTTASTNELSMASNVELSMMRSTQRVKVGEIKTSALLPTDNGTKETDVIDRGHDCAVILSYGGYCRYRALRRRLESPCINLQVDIVRALGGLSNCTVDCRPLFCRDTFEHHPLLDAHSDLCNHHLVPTLMRDRLMKAFSLPKNKNHRIIMNGDNRSGIGSQLSTSSDVSESSDEWIQSSTLSPNVTGAPTAVSAIAKVERLPRNGFINSTAQQSTEKQFLHKLFDFMRKRNTPIERAPSLGFKQVNLYSFYTHVKKLGGYEKITANRLWKRIYDKLGGNPGSTSAATITRRHYERLLLPFEKHVRSGENNVKKVEPNRNGLSSKSPCRQLSVSQASKSMIAFAEVDGIKANGSSKVATVSIVQKTNKSIDSKLNCSDKSPSVIVVPVPQSPMPSNRLMSQTASRHQMMTPMRSLLEQQRQERKQRIKDNRTAEKERMWDEIRRQNALERDRMRQLTAAAKIKTSLLGTGTRSTLQTKELLMSSRPINVVVPLESSQSRPILEIGSMKITMPTETDTVSKINNDVALNNRSFMDRAMDYNQNQSHRLYMNGSASDTITSNSACAQQRMLNVIQRTHALIFMGTTPIKDMKTNLIVHNNEEKLPCHLEREATYPKESTTIKPSLQKSTVSSIQQLSMCLDNGPFNGQNTINSSAHQLNMERMETNGHQPSHDPEVLDLTMRS